MLHYPSWPNMDERRWRPNSVEIAPNCPRCASSNTKFCYYNNYSLSQPRYFCKGCRRYWTKGGSLRNVPVGGGCRKSRRAKSSAMRASQSESSFSATYGSGFNGSSPLGDSSSSRRSGSSGSDIDLSAVFAKYLNQGSDFEKPVNMTDQEFATEAKVGCINSGEKIEEHNLMVVGDYNRRQELEECQDMINDFSVETDQTLLSGHEMTVQDCTLWSDSTNDLQNLTWQPMVELEEFDSFSTDDQIEFTSADFTSDSNNWNSASFDLYSELEFFSSP